ncbi:ABC transporter substrate-binding protein [Nostoc sp. PCC 7107]|uniref:ABC transporter substrate-binding protein n=1 Tax=Nostoc sp. PCC 7107 TaxID=317936 RepID=UPI00029EE815|nr:ABC transporter substrate-binding protein [Nostoc sp. PCC 7107]AFY43763.1 carbohydrate ABC transporter substrate-binding protein, CUT1 family [Nostoc sp. PCC 7107]
MKFTIFPFAVVKIIHQFLRSIWQVPLFVVILSVSLIFLSSCQAKEPQNNQVTHITLWQGINPPINRDVFQKLVDKFNQTHVDVQVESIYAGQLDQQLPKILTAVVAQVPPDILSFYPQVTGQFVELGAIVPLEDWLDKLSLKSEISPNLLEELTLDGHLWSIPLYTSNIGIFFRPSLFQAAGITNTPKTWQELREVSKKLTVDRNGDKQPEQYGMLLPMGKGEWTVFSWFPFLFSGGGEVISNGLPNLNHPGAIHALQFWQDLLKDGSAILSPPERGYEEDAFLQGRVAMQITGPWTYITKSKTDYQVFPIPSDVNQATVTGTGNLYLMKTTPEKEKAALQFLEYVLSEEFQTEWAIGTGFLPVNLKTAQSTAYQQYINQRPWMKVFLEQMSVARARPTLAGYNRLSDSLGRAIEASLMGESPQAALKKAQSRLDLIWGK